MGSWKSVLLGGGALLVLAGAGVVLGAVGQASGQAVPAITLSPASQTMAVGDGDFTIDIKVSNAQNLGAYEVTLKFDPTVLEYVGAGDYGFLATTGRSQTCIGHGLGAATVNQYAVVHVGCATNGLIQGGQGNQGPNGDGILTQIVFKPKAAGTANLQFDGYSDGNVNDSYYIGAPDPDFPAGAVEVGHTSLAPVETCEGNECSEQNITFTYGSGVVSVAGANAATATALPPTPTPEPPDGASGEEYQKTVAAAVGTPRTLPTSTTGGSTADPTAPSGTTSGSTTDGTTGGTTGGEVSGSGTTGAIVPPDTGERPLTAAELESTGYPEGSTVSADGTVRGPDGVPLTGYGPQSTGPDAIWYWAGFAILLVGLIAMASGVVSRRLAERRIDM